MITIAITGRRPKKLFDEYREAYADTNYDACEDALVRLLTKLAADNGGIHVQCGGAQGADMLAAEAALSAADAGAQIQLDLKLPYPGQDARWSVWGRFGQAALLQFHLAAEHPKGLGVAVHEGHLAPAGIVL